MNEKWRIHMQTTAGKLPIVCMYGRLSKLLTKMRKNDTKWRKMDQNMQRRERNMWDQLEWAQMRPYALIHALDACVDHTRRQQRFWEGAWLSRTWERLGKARRSLSCAAADMAPRGVLWLALGWHGWWRGSLARLGSTTPDASWHMAQVGWSV